MMPNIAIQRLRSQQIANTSLTSPSEVVSWMGAMQGQDYAGAKWSVGLRLPISSDAEIEKAISDKTIVRTWAMRGTLHMVTAQDIRWLLMLLGPRLIAGNARRYRELELNEDTLVRANGLMLKALQDGNQLDRPSLLAVLEQNGISATKQRGAFLLQRASLDSLICQGVTRSNNPVYMALEESLPEAQTMEHDEALAELAKRYFTSRGPATLQDFATWSGLLTEARAGLEAAKSQLIREEIDGQTYWLSGSTPRGQENSWPVYALPGFDEYLLGYKDRSAVLDPQYAQRIVPGGNGIFNPTIVIEGRVVGTWKRTFKKGAVVIVPTPFITLNASEYEAFTAAAQRYGEFLNMAVELDKDSA